MLRNGDATRRAAPPTKRRVPCARPLKTGNAGPLHPLPDEYE